MISDVLSVSCLWAGGEARPVPHFAARFGELNLVRQRARYRRHLPHPAPLRSWESQDGLPKRNPGSADRTKPRHSPNRSQSRQPKPGSSSVKTGGPRSDPDVSCVSPKPPASSGQRLSPPVTIQLPALEHPAAARSLHYPPRKHEGPFPVTSKFGAR